MIDVLKIKVGDEVTVRGKVAIVHHDDTQKPVRLVGGSWVEVADIVSHTPAPREFRPGDQVTWGTGAAVYEFVEVRDDIAALWSEDHGWRTHVHMRDLRHADKSE